MTYRPDIDGLRGLSVILVMLYHAGLGMPGGYVGVDVFFVISGFLITTLIADEASRGEFRLANFYLRRVRRLLPALFLLMVVITPVFGFVLLPGEFRDFGQSLVATVLFASNFLFWWETGYFDADAISKPLLHTWSLAIEEQFYLIYPALLLPGLRFLARRVLWIVITGLLFVSLAVSTLLLQSEPAASFYLLPSRMWELLAGALLALLADRIRLGSAGRGWAGAAGLLMILGSAATYSHATPFPGLAAVLPCSGALLLLVAGLGGAPMHGVSAGLRFAPLQYVGRLSYSLYLWHWPVLVVVMLVLAREPDVVEGILALALASLLAALSYHLVERPCRNPATVTTYPLLVGVVFAGLLITAAGTAIHVRAGLPERLPADALAMTPGQQEQNKVPVICRRSADVALGPIVAGRCHFGTGTGHFVWGDSHAVALLPGLAEYVGGEYVAHQLCPPLLGVDVAHVVVSRHSTCRRFNQLVVETLAARTDIETIVLVAHWSLYANGERLHTDPRRDRVYLLDGTDRDNLPVLADGLARTVATLTALGLDVILIGPVPEIGVFGQSAIARQHWLGLDRELRMPAAEMHARLDPVETAIARMASRSGVRFLPLSSKLCAEEFCAVEGNGLPLYVDRHHLSPAGARYVLATGDSVLVSP